MFSVLLSLIVSFGITYFILPVVICMSQYLRIHDVPDERKIHVTPKPSLGGLGIFTGIMITVLTVIPFTSAFEFQYYVAAALVLFFVGLKDDLDGMSPFRKIIGQALATFLVVHKGGVELNNMYGFLGIYQLSEMQSLLLTYFAILVIINSMNLIDGVDGLAGSLGLMIATVLGLYFMKAGVPSYAALSFALAGSLAAFLIFNFQPSRIFMGDTGSLLVGLICAILVLKFVNTAAFNSIVAVTASPAIGFTILMVPLLDCLRVFVTRILSCRSPFSPDKNHIHHLLLAAGLSHKHVTIMLVSVNLSCIVFSYAIQGIGNTWLIATILTLFFTGTGVLKYLLRKQHIFARKAVRDTTPLKLKMPLKVVTLNKHVTIKENELVKNLSQ